MAESMQTMEGELSCSICVDIFREPVSLPCHHSFCRECLRLFAEKAKSDESEDKTSSCHPQKINCPVCRSLPVLAQDDVSTLPVDTELCEKIKAFQSTVKAKHDASLCSMCEDTSPSPATMLCSTGDVYFCQDCLVIMHPMRGPLKRHTLKPANEIFDQKMTESHMMTEKRAGSDSRPACDKQSQPLCIYCVTCKTVICPGCIVEHPEPAST